MCVFDNISATISYLPLFHYGSVFYSVSLKGLRVISMVSMQTQWLHSSGRLVIQSHALTFHTASFDVADTFLTKSVYIHRGKFEPPRVWSGP